MTIKLDTLNDFEKSLINNIFDHYIKNIRSTASSFSEVALANDKRFTSSITNKIEIGNYEFTKDELKFLDDVLGYSFTYLVDGDIAPYINESQIDNAYTSFKKLSRTLEAFLD